MDSICNTDRNSISDDSNFSFSYISLTIKSRKNRKRCKGSLTTRKGLEMSNTRIRGFNRIVFKIYTPFACIALIITFILHFDISTFIFHLVRRKQSVGARIDKSGQVCSSFSCYWREQYITRSCKCFSQRTVTKFNLLFRDIASPLF